MKNVDIYTPERRKRLHAMQRTPWLRLLANVLAVGLLTITGILYLFLVVWSFTHE